MKTSKFSKNLQQYIIKSNYQYSGIDSNKKNFVFSFDDTTIQATKLENGIWKTNIVYNVITIPSGNEIDRRLMLQQIFIEDDDLKFLYNLPIRSNKENI